MLSALGHAVKPVSTNGPGSAAGIARKAIEDGADVILVAGGDGTINEVVNGMAHSNVPLGILPAGTANVLANELGIGNTMECAANALGDCVSERIALGLLTPQSITTPRYFLLMTGAGLDAEIVYRLSPRLKNALGKLAYWVGGFRKVGTRLTEFSVRAEGMEFTASFALASRVRNYGGDLEIAPTISLLDDEFELVLFEGSSSFTFLWYMLGVVVRQHPSMRGITILRTRKISIGAPAERDIHLQVDGEYVGLAPATIEIVPNSLSLLVPSHFRTRRPASIDETAWTTSPTR